MHQRSCAKGGAFYAKGQMGKKCKTDGQEGEPGEPAGFKKADGVRRRGWKRSLLVSLLVLLIGGGTAFYFVFDVASWQTLDIRKMTEIPQTGAIYDRNGEFVAKIQSAQDRVSIPLSEVPKDVRNAFLAAEDLRFYQHNGIDLIRIFGALRSNFRAGDYAEGASTISEMVF